jgi:flavin reductase (DIM6/NTAB) family NADH-FMN oxidoreductase RutF
VDKLERYGLQTFEGAAVGAPLIEGCVGWLECRLIDEPELRRRHDLFLAEVVAAGADSRAFDGEKWEFQLDELRTIHHLSGAQFFETGTRLAAEGRPSN